MKIGLVLNCYWLKKTDFVSLSYLWNKKNRFHVCDWDIVFWPTKVFVSDCFSLEQFIRPATHTTHTTSQALRMKTQWRLLRHREWFEGVSSMHGTICCIYFHLSSVGCKRTWQESLDVYTYSCDWKHFVDSMNYGHIFYGLHIVNITRLNDQLMTRETLI